MTTTLTAAPTTAPTTEPITEPINTAGVIGPGRVRETVPSGPAPVGRAVQDPRVDSGPRHPPVVEVLATGPSATIQDLGRPGLAELGVGASGAADPPSLRLANRLVGNPESHAAIETTFGGLRVRMTRAALVAVTGAPCPLTLNVPRDGGIQRRAAGMYSPVYVPADTELSLGAPSQGVRSYLAVRGGIAVPLVLGSRASDTLAGLGPPPLAVGAVLPIGERALDHPTADLAPQPGYPDRPVLRVLPGPREDWFVDDALDTLTNPGGYAVTERSNRVGARLDGPPLRHRAARELPPEPTVTGALQVPPDGAPILFLVDHPVTGGYPVIAVVHPDDIPLAAQARPGTRLRFTLDPAAHTHHRFTRPSDPTTEQPERQP